MMQMNERSEAIRRAQRALKALGEHPRSSKKELGHAREHVNACYSHGSGEYVWNAVAQVEAMADRRYGVPSTEEAASDGRGDRGPRGPRGACDSRPRPSGGGPRSPATGVDPRRGARAHCIAMKWARRAQDGVRTPLRERQPLPAGSQTPLRCGRAILSVLAPSTSQA